MNTRPRLTIALVVWLACSAAIAGRLLPAAEPAKRSASEPILQLANGDFLAGQLVASDGPRPAWRSPAFDEPFSFALGSLAGIQFPLPAEPVPPQGDFCFELSGHDALFGDLVSLSATDVVIRSTELGELHVERSRLRRISPRDQAGLTIFNGPGLLKDWTASGPEESRWTQDAGHLATHHSGARLDREFALPVRARFEIELSWKTKLELDLSLGVGGNKNGGQPFRLEVWNEQLVAVRETEIDGDLVPLAEISPGAGRLSLLVFLDQTEGRLLAFTAAGKQLAELKVAAKNPVVQGGVRLVNRAGDVRLERLVIGRWSGETPQAVADDKARFHRSDGTILYGELKAYDGEKREFVVATSDGDRPLPAGELNDAVFPQDEELPPCAVQVSDAAGQRLSGQWEKVDDRALWLKSPGIRDSMTLPLNQLTNVRGLAPQPAVAELPGRKGLLEAEGLRLNGCWLDSPAESSGRLVWQPELALAAAGLKRLAAVQVTYRAPPPPPKVTPPKPAPAAVNRPAREAQPNRRKYGDTRLPANPRSQPSVIHLRTGDKFPCEITGIDERGVNFKSAITTAVSIPHSEVKVVELLADTPAVSIYKPKKERLLMLPRMQRDSPPTQLIRAVNGDYLRCRILSMDELELQAEVRLKTETIPRRRIARIIWLHDEELRGGADSKPENEPAPEAAPPAGLRLQTLLNDGNRLTFAAERVAKDVLSGQSTLLGPCQVELSRVDQIFIGAAIEQAADQLAFHQWRLRPAPDPLFVNEEGGDDADGGDDGQSSKLVGKPAPDFKLELLSGGQFRLSEHRQKIVVLDFWATWCGPCMQALPHLDQVTREFSDRGVEFFAVNLEESPDQIQRTLKRLKLELNVVLDLDGTAAAKYNTTAIPQTVIVDREGNVARLFVGGGPQFEDQLRAALEKLSQPKASP